MRRNRAILVALAFFAEGCAHGAATRGVHPVLPVGPSAVITATEATFVFPPETTVDYSRQTEGKCSGTAEYTWMVYWWPHDESRLGSDPTALWLTIRCGSIPSGRGSLVELVTSVRPTVMTYIRESEPPASRAADDDALTAVVQDGRVVFHIRGRPAVRRILAAVPDSVTLIRVDRPANSEAKFPIPVVRR